MEETLTLEQLVKKVKQQEETIIQLVKIIASTNKRVAELQVKQETIEKMIPY